MPFYHDFVTARTTTVDEAALIAAVRQQLGDPTVGLMHILGGEGVGMQTPIIGKKAGEWTAADIATTQDAIDNAPPLQAFRLTEAEWASLITQLRARGL